jgi:hypothetical protein
MKARNRSGRHSAARTQSVNRMEKRQIRNVAWSRNAGLAAPGGRSWVGVGAAVWIVAAWGSGVAAGAARASGEGAEGADESGAYAVGVAQRSIVDCVPAPSQGAMGAPGSIGGIATLAAARQGSAPYAVKRATMARPVNGRARMIDQCTLQESDSTATRAATTTSAALARPSSRRGYWFDQSTSA